MIGLDLALALDPSMIATMANIVPDAWQRKLLCSTAPRVLLLCARQTGKTTTTALVAIATAMTVAGALVLIVSPSQRQSAEMFRTAMTLYKRIQSAPEIVQESVLKAELKNGSRIVALPGNEATVRGYAGATLILIDEASRVPDELLTAVRPMLATSNGRLIALTTPAGKRGWFYDAWVGTENWERVRVTAKECPRISQAFLDEELKALGPLRFSAEFDLEFLDNTDAVFGLEAIDKMFSAEVAPLCL